MTKMIVAVVAVALVPFLAAQTKTTSSVVAGKVARGKYLVENVGMCNDCHTPRNEKGELIKAHWLKGTTLDFKPIVPIPVWAEKSSNIAGLPGWEEAAAVKFFMSGIAYNGLPARPPMPQYRFNREDSEAIVAYLKSLETIK